MDSFYRLRVTSQRVPLNQELALSYSTVPTHRPLSAMNSQKDLGRPLLNSLGSYKLESMSPCGRDHNDFHAVDSHFSSHSGANSAPYFSSCLPICNHPVDNDLPLLFSFPGLASYCPPGLSRGPAFSPPPSIFTLNQSSGCISPPAANWQSP